MAKKLYILKTVGITIPNYDRKDLKVGMSVSIEEKVGDKFASRGFLVKANAAAPKAEKANAALEKENKNLKQANDDLIKERDELAEENKTLEEANKTLTDQLEEAAKPVE